MSFFNTIKGFTRSSKKKAGNDNNNGNNKANGGRLGNNYNEIYLNNDSSTSLPPQVSLYSNNNGSNLSLRRTQSPSKQSVRSQKLAYSQAQVQSQQQAQQAQQAQQVQSQAQSHSQVQQAQIQAFQQRAATANTKPPLFLCEPFVKTALVKGSYKTIVQLPKYVDLQEWLALNVFESFNHLNKFYGVIAEYVTPDKYPIMTADYKTEYVWVMNNKNVSLPANQYIDYALTWMNNKISDQSIFPTKTGMAFPPSFLKDIKSICRQMFRIIAHIYHNHFEKIVHLSLEAHWNSYFAHFISFIGEFDLIEKRELEPLNALIENLESQGKIYHIEKTVHTLNPTNAVTISS